MCEENKTSCEKKSCGLKGDVRMFCIALLTTVIVLALYHFGMGICAILTGTSSCSSMPVTRDYVLVPVSAMPQKAPGFGEGRRFPRGEFQKGPRGEFHRRGFHGHRPEGRPGMMRPEGQPAPAAQPAQ